MSGKTKIEWATDQWNPVTGCSKVSQGCKHCYAEREWPRLAAPRAKPNIYTGRAFTDVRCHPEKLDIPLRWTKPRRIFVNSMSDLFHDDVPDDFIFDVFYVMERAKHHTFQVLTKRPERMLELIGEPVNAGEKAPPQNIWFGVSVEDQATADERIPLLLQTPAAVRWISAEPLLGPVNLRQIMARGPWTNYTDALSGYHTKFAGPGCSSYPGERLDWIVVGGESGPKARPMHPDWVRSLRDQCQEAGAPFFFKQWGEWELFVDEALKGPLIEIEPEYWMVRTGKKNSGRVLDGRTWDEYPILEKAI